MTTDEDRDKRLEDIGRGAMESIAEMVAKLDAMVQVSECCGADTTKGICDDCDQPCTLVDGDDPDDETREKAHDEILEDPLSLEVRGGWHAPGEDTRPEEFCLLLRTGGPAVRIIGELNEHCEPTRARLETQDWFTPWTEYVNADHDVLLTYCQQFYFGEG